MRGRRVAARQVAFDMCLTVYMATAGPHEPARGPDLGVEELKTTEEAVRQWFSLPTVRALTAHGTCGCGFPSVMADQPIEYFDGMLDDADDRPAGVRSVGALLALIRRHLASAGEVELLAVWNGDEGLPPKGTLEVSIASLVPDTFFFNERFLYRVSR